MDNVIKEMVDFFARILSPGGEVEARNFVQNPLQTASSAAGQSVTAAQLQTAYTAVAPASVALGGGDPVLGMQQAVANTHGIAFAPVRQTEVLSHNDTLSNNDVLSHNDPRFLSPDAGGDVQQGGVNVGLDFGDITFGDKNTASDGSVINTGNAGDIDATNVEGDGNVVGDDNENVNTGDIEDSNVNIGEDNEIDDDSQTAGGDIISDNEGPVINDVDMSGGNGGSASGGDGGGGLIGVGNDGGNATGGAGGSGGGIVINDNDTTNVDGNQTTVDSGGGDINGGVSGGTNTEDNSVDNSVDNSTDNSGQDNSVDNSTDNSGQVNTDVDVSTNVDAGLF